MSYKFNRKSLANTIAIHNYELKGVKYNELFAFFESWLLESGFEPTKMDGKSGKNITYSRGKNALLKEDFKYMREEGLSILCLPPDDQIGTEAFDYKAMLYISKPYEIEKRNRCIFSWDDTLLPWDKNIYLDLIKNIYMFFKPKYGYAFQRIFNLGPSMYPWGVISGLTYDQEQERKEMGNWGTIGVGTHPSYRPHFIRDVYRLNFLSPQHLQGSVAETTLEAWIKQNPERGTLETVIGDLWCWSVDEANIPKVREDLKPYNILIALMDR